MTVDDIKDFVVAIDPDADHYESEYREGASYTVWYEQGPIEEDSGDGEYLGGIKFTIARITREENDVIAAALYAALDASDTIAFQYKPDFDPESGYILHIFACEGA